VEHHKQRTSRWHSEIIFEAAIALLSVSDDATELPQRLQS
jgi:hypothetical protein